MTSQDEHKPLDNVTEDMAEAAHEAWMSYYADRGIKSRKAEWGEEFMVPFSELSEDGKDLDRTIMRAILDKLDALGLQVVAKAQKDTTRASD